MKSMTGFGKSKLEINGRVYNIEIKSVNHRYCDVNVRLPRSISCYENEIKKEVSNRVARGKIDVFIDFANYTNEGKNVVINKELAKLYIKQLKELANEECLNDNINITEISKMPDVLQLTSEDDENDTILQELKQCLNSALDNFVNMRFIEGERIKEDEMVTLYISSGSNSVTVPKFVGYIKSKAEEIAESNDLVLNVEYVTSDELAGTVVDQDVKEGEKVAPKSEIKIKVSSGGVDEEVKVPDFSRKTKEEAEELLKEIGLTGKFIDGYSDTVPEGQVMDQGIDANSLTTKDTVLTLTVSQGPNKAVSEAQDEVTTLTPVISLPSSEPKEEKTTAPQHGQAVRENNETVKPVQSSAATTRSVSVSVSPDFNNNSYNTDGSDVYSVKVVAESKNGSTRTILNDKYKVSDFPFSVNDKINSDTTYKVYLNNQVISTENH